MFKRILLFFMLIITPVYAGTLENAVKNNKYVFAYFYSDDCRICRMFDETLPKLKAEMKDFAFVKIDVDTSYGRYQFLKYKGRYVPYIILINSKKNTNVTVSSSCVLDELCMMRVMKRFKQ